MLLLQGHIFSESLTDELKAKEEKTLLYSPRKAPSLDRKRDYSIRIYLPAD